MTALLPEGEQSRNEIRKWVFLVGVFHPEFGGYSWLRVRFFLRENSLLVFGRQTAKSLWRSDPLNIGSKQLCSCSSSGPPGVLERAQDRSPKRGPGTSYLFNLCPPPRACFTCGRWGLARWPPGFSIMVPLEAAGSYSGVIKRLGDSASETGGRRGSPKSWSRIRATRAGFLSSLYFRLAPRARPSPHVLC